MLKYAARSDVGCRRSNNEDNFAAAPEHNLWILADGVGGHDAGEIASEIACQVIRDQVAQGHDLEVAIVKAHEAILAAPEKGHGRPGMASTVVALTADDSGFEVAWVGDSRCYLWSEERGLEQISRDHSLVQRLLEEQHINEEEAANHPGRNIVLQALGQDNVEKLQVDAIRDSFEPGQILLMCSDGLNDYVPHDDIVASFRASDDVDEIADSLVAKTLANNGADNVTVVLVQAPSETERREREQAENVATGGKSASRQSLLLVAGLLVLGALYYFFQGSV
ncbi:protein phosphatase [Litorivivens lipolytica]|uniref:Protein phosphatase n=1 Tax=Litorivivens lipolytica TaxID=1524264 RepID=A0A7W4Z7V9_9GAMM|nr:protein phosphatase 2C domain-containing protein [Litorivivens lipolytica]MBB3048301.1 protein phosphatase [Litorivivens lipolytica]